MRSRRSGSWAGSESIVQPECEWPCFAPDTFDVVKNGDFAKRVIPWHCWLDWKRAKSLRADRRNPKLSFVASKLRSPGRYPEANNTCWAGYPPLYPGALDERIHRNRRLTPIHLRRGSEQG